MIARKAFLLSPLLALLLCSASMAATGAKDTSSKVSVGQTAPVFSGATTDDKTISLDQLKGKVVLVNFFATW